MGQRRRWEHHRAYSVTLSARETHLFFWRKKRQRTLPAMEGTPKSSGLQSSLDGRHAMSAPPVLAPGPAGVSGSAIVDGLNCHDILLVWPRQTHTQETYTGYVFLANTSTLYMCCFSTNESIQWYTYRCNMLALYTQHRAWYVTAYQEEPAS